MNYSEIFIRVIKIISLKTQILEVELESNTRISDLGIDSLDLMELEMEIEEEFNIPLNITDSIPDDINDIVYQIQKKLQ